MRDDERVGMYASFLGALVIYLAFTILDLVFDGRFDWIFFLIYWDFMFAVTLVLYKFRKDMRELRREQISGSY